MAVDEALLATAAASGQTTLRFYRWSEPTLSLGYFQAVSSRAHHPASLACPVVRRATGGGAIVHDQELTYSFCTPVANRMSQSALPLYQLFHDSLVETLKIWHIEARLWKTTTKAKTHDEPFLCFQRRSDGDVVIKNQKVAGSAQRRHHGTVLQHGSILLRRSNSAPELDGIEQVAQTTIDVLDLASRFAEQLARLLQVTFAESQLASHEIQVARRIDAEKFAHHGWTNKR